MTALPGGSPTRSLAASNLFPNTQDEDSVKPLLELVDQVSLANGLCSLPLLLSNLHGLLTLSFPGFAFTFAVTKDHVSFGRTETDIILPSLIISEREADLKIHNGGRARLMVHSKNQACYINSMPVLNGEYELQDGACVQFANAVVCWYEASERNLGHCLTKASAETTGPDDTVNQSQLVDVNSILSNPNTPAALSDKSNLINTHSTLKNKMLSGFSSPFKSPLPKASQDDCTNVPLQPRGIKRARPDDLHNESSENYDPGEAEAMIKRQKLYDGSPSKTIDVSPIHSPNKLVKAKTTSAGKRRRLYSSPFQRRGLDAPPLSVPRPRGMPSPLGFPPKDASLVPPSPEKSVIPPTWDPTPCKSDTVEQRRTPSFRVSPSIPSPSLEPYVHINTPRPAATESDRQSFALHSNYTDLLENAATEDFVPGKSRHEHLREKEVYKELAKATQRDSPTTNDRLSSSSDVSMLDTSVLAAEIALSMEPETKQITSKDNLKAFATQEASHTVTPNQLEFAKRALLPSAFPFSPVRTEPTSLRSEPRATRALTPPMKTMPRPSRTSPKKASVNGEATISLSEIHNTNQFSFLPMMQSSELEAASFEESNPSESAHRVSQDFQDIERSVDRRGSESIQKRPFLDRLSNSAVTTPKNKILSPQPLSSREEPGTPSKSSPVKSASRASPAGKLVATLRASPSKTNSPHRMAVVFNQGESLFKKPSPLKNVVDMGSPEIQSSPTRSPLVSLTDIPLPELITDVVGRELESPLIEKTVDQLTPSNLSTNNQALPDSNDEVSKGFGETAAQTSSPSQKDVEPLVDRGGDKQAETHKPAEASESLLTGPSRRSARCRNMANEVQEPRPEVKKSSHNTRKNTTAKSSRNVKAKQTSKASEVEKGRIVVTTGEAIEPVQTRRGRKATDKADNSTTAVASRTRTHVPATVKKDTNVKPAARKKREAASLPVAKEDTAAQKTRRSARAKEEMAPVKEAAAHRAKRVAKEVVNDDAIQLTQSKAKRTRTTVKAEKDTAKTGAAKKKPVAKAGKASGAVQNVTRQSSRLTRSKG